MNQNLNVLTELARAVVEAVAPLVAEHLDVQDAARILKQAVATYMRERKALSTTALAAHLGKSERWVYNHLKAQQQGENAPPPNRHIVLNFFGDHHGRSWTIKECDDALQALGHRISQEELINLVEAYCTFGYLEKDGHAYRWRVSILSHNSGELTSRSQRVQGLLPRVVDLFVRYVRNEGVMIGQSQLSICREAYQEMEKELYQGLFAAIDRAVKRSRELDPEETSTDQVLVDCMVLLGSVPIKKPK